MLDGPLALLGYFLILVLGAPSMVPLMVLFLCRLVLRRTLLASCAYIAAWTVTLPLL